LLHLRRHVSHLWRDTALPWHLTSSRLLCRLLCRLKLHLLGQTSLVQLHLAHHLLHLIHLHRVHLHLRRLPLSWVVTSSSHLLHVKGMETLGRPKLGRHGSTTRKASWNAALHLLLSRLLCLSLSLSLGLRLSCSQEGLVHRVGVVRWLLLSDNGRNLLVLVPLLSSLSSLRLLLAALSPRRNLSPLLTLVRVVAILLLVLLVGEIRTTFLPVLCRRVIRVVVVVVVVRFVATLGAVASLGFTAFTAFSLLTGHGQKVRSNGAKLQWCLAIVSSLLGSRSFSTVLSVGASSVDWIVWL
jgi:hypothetical protein